MQDALVFSCPSNLALPNSPSVCLSGFISFLRWLESLFFKTLPFPTIAPNVYWLGCRLLQERLKQGDVQCLGIFLSGGQGKSH